MVMKKFIVSLVCFACIGAHAQSSKWFVSLSPGFYVGGPLVSVKKQVVAQGFNGTSRFDFFGVGFSAQFPEIVKGASFLVRAGRRISAYKSIYFTGGIVSSGHLTGFKPDGTYTDFFILGATGGEWMVFKYK